MSSFKLITIIAVIALTVSTFALLTSVQHLGMEKAMQDNGNGSVHEKERQAATLKAKLGEVLDDPSLVNHPVEGETTAVSGFSWMDRLRKLIGGSMNAIKKLPESAGHRTSRPRLAPPGVYFTLVPLSVRIPSGIAGVSAGTRVVCVKDEGAVLIVKMGDVQFEVKRSYVTNNLDLADLAYSNDAEAQQAVARAIAEQVAVDQARRHEENVTLSQEQQRIEAQRAAAAKASGYLNPLERSPYDNATSTSSPP